MVKPGRRPSLGTIRGGTVLLRETAGLQPTRRGMLQLVADRMPDLDRAVRDMLDQRVAVDRADVARLLEHRQDVARLTSFSNTGGSNAF